MKSFLKWSSYISLPVAVLGIVFAILQIVFSSKMLGQSEKSYFTRSLQGGDVVLLSLRGAIHGRNGYPGSVSHLIRNMETAKESTNIKAILLSIDSPGGTVSATKKLYNKISSVRKKKPVIALIEGLAASGAYYVASACDRIVSSEAATVGSIGVLSTHVEFHQLLKKHGIHAEMFKAGRYKDIGSPFRKMTPQERQMYQELIDEFYLLFLRDVAHGRKQKMTKVKTWAEGKIFSARKALRLGMLDKIGGRKEALKEIKILLKIKDDLKIIEPPKNFEYFLEKYLSQYTNSNRIQINLSLLQDPVLFFYPRVFFLQKMISNPSSIVQ